MHTLHIEGTYTSAADGEKFLKTLAADDFDSLQSLTIADEKKWFEGGRDGCIDSLVTIIAKQHELKFLNMQGKYEDEYQDYELIEEQELRIRSAIA